MSGTNQNGQNEAPGVGLRRTILSKSAADLGFESDAEFPTIWGVVVDFSIGEAIATVVALRDGTASLYTTGNFGMIGGERFLSVRHAAITCVKESAQILSEHAGAFERVDTFAYPEEGRMNFHLLGYDGVERASVSEEEVYNRAHLLTPIFAYAQGVLTELRLASDIE